MRGTTHQLVGAGFGLAVLAVAQHYDVPVSLTEAGVLVGSSAIGALIPDIDHTESKISKKVPFFAWPIYLLNKFFGFLRDHSPKGIKNFFGYFAKGFGHRGFCHAAILWIALTYLAYINLSGIWGIVWFGLAMGGLSHIVADSFNPSGIPLFLPLSFKRVSIGRISTGSGGEDVFKAFIILLDLGLIYFLWKGVI